MDKSVRRYAGLYRKALEEFNYSDIDGLMKRYETRLKNMYDSPAFKAHNIYPSMNVVLIYAVIAMCLELKEKGLSDQKIMEFSDTVFRKRKKAVAILEKIIAALPGTYRIVEKWNIDDHEKRVKDKSITYDLFEVEDGKIEYRISRCMYVEIFAYYGIRSLCRIFCNTDISAYSQLERKVRFRRYSDLSDKDCCHDVIERR